MTDKIYNGWTNHATWLVNLYWGDYIRDLDVEVENADHLEEIIYTNCQESVDSSFVMDMFTGYMDEVNWQEILDNLKG